jgi:hypothetical protein
VKSGGIDRFSRFVGRRRNITDGRDSIISNTDIGFHGRCACAIDYSTASNYNIESQIISPVPGWREEQLLSHHVNCQTWAGYAATRQWSSNS